MHLSTLQSDPSPFPLQEAEWGQIVRRLGLSVRESQIVAQVLADEKEQAIAARLAISCHTVHAHLKRVYAKLGAASRVELAMRVFAEYAALVREGELPSSRSPQFTLRRAA
jgi:DNA-binding CsgD family transcriptional regulator